MSDKDRPLSDQGLQTCQSIAMKMQDDEIHPDLIVCSTALRTRQTLDAICPIWRITPEIVYEDRIYEASTTNIRFALSTHTASYKDIMVIGHNPGLQDLALQLSNTPGAPSYKEALSDFPPGCMAKLFGDDIAWEDITPGKFTFLKLYQP